MEDRRVLAPSRRLVVLLVVVGMFTAGMLWWVAPWHTARPITLTGSAYANGELTAIAFTADSRLRAMRAGLSAEGEGFVVAGVDWVDTAGAWHHGTPPACLVPAETSRIELSFVRVRYGGGDGGPTRVVTSLRCLE